ncbi:DUF881 domain-containing protein [Alloiococcus sp. CFN-8]|uniref:DUF881 domain-containing protein n=1 Tax=Alloiococcus sp. CFN-8 TaxID=3416081 RepID=UPI003CF82377
MKITKGSLYIFISSVLIGILLVVNISFKEDDIIRGKFLSAKEYQEAQNNRTSLYKEIASLREQYYVSLDKIDNYRYSSESTSQVLQDMEEESLINNMLLGKIDVKGPGVTMVISDGSVDHTLGIDDPYLQNLRTVHNYDIMNIINELKLSGAEAISINDQRILPTSEIYCSWAFISVNGVKLPAPFIVKAIGDAEVIENYLNRTESYTKTLINRGINVYITKAEEILLPAIGNRLQMNYLKSAN